jgi:hypothetical protein
VRRGLLLAVLVLAGCGGEATQDDGPKLPRPLGQAWDRQADDAADALGDGDQCLAQRRLRQLQTDVIAAINAKRVPPGLQEELLGAVNDSAARVLCDRGATPPTAEQRIRQLAESISRWTR